MRPTTLLLLLLLAVVPVTHAADPALEAKLKEAKLEYVIDGDGDYKIIYEWSQDQRSQVVFISGQPEGLEGVRLYSVFSPAKVLDEGEALDPALAARLLGENSTYKFGAWELAGRNLFFAGDIPSAASAADIATLVATLAGTADDLEIEISPGEDAY